MKQNLMDALLKKCIAHYQKMYEDGMQWTPPERYGSPPESIVIVLGSLKKNDTSAMYLLAHKEIAFRYSSAELRKVDPDTQPDLTENKAYYKEAYAELSYHDNGNAFVMVQFGKRYASCYRYHIIEDNGMVQLTDEKLLWVS